MKTDYLKPALAEIVLQTPSVICSSFVDGIDGGTSDYIDDEEPDFF